MVKQLLNKSNKVSKQEDLFNIQKKPIIKVKDPKFRNDPRITNKINPNVPIFKRNIRGEHISDGHSKLNNKILASKHAI